MASYRLTSQAEEDLLAEHEQLGQALPDIRADVRYFPVKRYLVLSRQLPDGIEMVRVVHGSRGLGALFEPGDSDDPPATTRPSG